MIVPFSPFWLVGFIIVFTGNRWIRSCRFRTHFVYQVCVPVVLDKKDRAKKKITIIVPKVSKYWRPDLFCVLKNSEYISTPRGFTTSLATTVHSFVKILFKKTCFINFKIKNNLTLPLLSQNVKVLVSSQFSETRNLLIWN